MTTSFAENMDEFISHLPEGSLRQAMVEAFQGYLYWMHAGYPATCDFKMTPNPQKPREKTVVELTAENDRLRRELEQERYSWP